MAKRISISVPTPCHEKWQDMTPAEKGRFCFMCQKNVRDFTKSSDREIAEAIKEPKTCGRFLSSQLERELILPQRKSSLWLAAGAAVMGFLALGNYEAVAQTPVVTEQGEKKQATDAPIVPNVDTIIITGYVIDNFDLIPVPGINVRNLNTADSVTTDFDGKFKIKADVNNILEFSYLGYKMHQIIVQSEKSVIVHIEPENMLIGEVAVERHSFARRIFRAIGNWFR